MKKHTQLMLMLLLTVAAGTAGISAAQETGNDSKAAFGNDVQVQDAAKEDASQKDPAASPAESDRKDTKKADKGRAKKEERKQQKEGAENGTEKEGDIVPYPLEDCLVTDNKLGSMGDPITIVHEGKEIKFCCKPCEGKFKKDPAKYLPKLDGEG